MRKSSIAAMALLMGAAALLVSGADLEVRLRSKHALARTGADAGVFWEEGSSGMATGRPDSLAELAAALSPAVVNIQAERRAQPRSGKQSPFEEFFGRRHPPRGEASGTGFVISKDGYIVTNNHVVEKATRVTVTFDDGMEFQAEIVGVDPKTDLGLIKIKADKDLPHAPLGDSNDSRVGDWVMAIGNPFGLEHTVTVGILSARGRNIGTGPYDNFLQTDASINPGNSGGPLIDMKGRVIGINTAINAAGQGIGFAIPINMAKDLLPQLRQKGSVTRGWLGVQIQRVTPAFADQYELDSTAGAVVSQVFDDSPAARAKLERGDVIIEFDGSRIETFNDLPRKVASVPPGTEVPLLVIRDGKEKTLRATLDTMEEEKTVQLTSREPTQTSRWGFEADGLTSELVERLSLPSGTEGVVVIKVAPDSPASEAGLEANDVIVEANRTTIQDLDDLDKVLDEEPGQLVFFVQRRGSSLYIALEKS